ncbi:MAG: RsmB/NOP family class I SAM-dependent RNA methyltransferase [Candidatus Heimdallarchaeota archaeon]|nr:RsmB/NOP family class I SAM-dependent RNA methyltransferase [Candidatus Heimdallarchaeota archaeon]
MSSIIPIVISALEDIDNGKSLRTVLRYYVNHHNLDREAESTLYYYTHEIYRRLNWIDLFIKYSSSNFSLKRIKSDMRALLRVATHMLKINNKISDDIVAMLEPYYSPVGDMSLSSLLNLIQAVTEEDLYENREDLASKFSLKYYTYTWIIRKFFKQWGEEFAENVLNSFRENIPMYIRVNTLKADCEDVKRSLSEYEIKYVVINSIPNLVRIDETPIPIPRLEEFKSGKIVIQQKASALVSLVLDPQPDEKILDMCASPGGKTSHIAALTGSGKNILAVDLNKDRVKILTERLKLLGVKETEIRSMDARNLTTKVKTKYDKILLDPPCSGSGTYSSRPDIKWRMKQRDLGWYIKLQSDLLDESSKLLGSDGHLVYSTCSLFEEENHDIISKFLENNSNFSLIEASPMIGVSSNKLYNKAQELFPHLHETEGFFIAKMKKEGN